MNLFSDDRFFEKSLQKWNYRWPVEILNLSFRRFQRSSHKRTSVSCAFQYKNPGLCEPNPEKRTLKEKRLLLSLCPDYLATSKIGPWICV